MKKLYYVEIHTGTVYETWAVSAKKAISNIRHRIFGSGYGVPTTYWKVWTA